MQSRVVYSSPLAGNGNIKTYYLPDVWDLLDMISVCELDSNPFYYCLGLTDLYALSRLVVAVAVVAHAKQGKFWNSSPFHCILSPFLIVCACFVEFTLT
jgi:hypothetical protein